MIPAPQWRSPQSSGSGGEEFLPGASEPDSLDRRDFLRMAGLSLAALTASACTRQPREEIVPYVRQPEDSPPGVARWYATSMDVGGHNAVGLLARSHEGRPTKLEGNPDHPMSLGRSSVHAQAALYDLYDPRRSQVVRRDGEPSTWEDFLGALEPLRAQWREKRGRGLCLVSDRFTSPSVHAQAEALLAQYPEAGWFIDDVPPLAAEGFTCDLESVDLLLCIDCDFLGGAYGTVPRDALTFSRRKRQRPIRLHVWESMPTLTGAQADERRPLSPADIVTALQELTAALTGNRAGPPWINALAKEWQAHQGRAAVLIGGTQSLLARQLAAALSESPEPRKFLRAPASTREFLEDFRSGKLEQLLVLGRAPSWLPEAPFAIHCGPYAEEGERPCAWHIPESHFLECWGDTLAEDGTHGIVQPLIEPLYASKSRLEFLVTLRGASPAPSGYEIVRDTAASALGDTDLEIAWQKALRTGRLPEPRGRAAGPARHVPEAERAQPAKDLELIIRPDPYLWDGRFSRNVLLQELPRPITKIAWENAACLSPETARQQGIAQGQIVLLQYQGKELRAPVFIVPGHADQCVTVHLGYGRGLDAGFRAELLQAPETPWGGDGLTLAGTAARHEFATTQEHQTMEVAEPVRTWPFDKEATPPSLYPPVIYDHAAWGMVIDLETCTGCSACTIACQVENNIPVVGREQVMKGRAMQWIRVDRYFTGDDAAPGIVHQPVPCMHCENAPCELVCPVGATVHDHQGLNLMVYNRCVGTRYCANNCPYKVRRFNFFQYTDRAESLALGRNPEVSVRMRGVMEKCTYCLQRISAAQIAADKEDRPIRDGEVVPACAQACPSDAIAFGNINDPRSAVSQRRAEPRNYGLLADLNTRPRTTYLARKKR